MLLNYLKLSLRLMMRNPFYTLISVSGLTIGVVSFYILWMYASSQLKTDQFHPNYNRIARLGFTWEWNDTGVWNKVESGGFRPSLAPVVKNDFPEVEGYVRILANPTFSTELVGHGQRVHFSTVDKRMTRNFNEDKVIYADPNLFEFFAFPLIIGEKSRVLAEPRAVVLSQSTATKYFGEANPVGELLRLNDSTILKVTGVYEDLPDNTHFEFDIVISNLEHAPRWSNVFVGFAATYVRLKEESFAEFQDKLNLQIDKYWGDVLKHFFTVRVTMTVHPLKEISFDGAHVGDLSAPRSRPFLYTLEFISLAVLFMAWANHVNLSTIRTVKRFKEIAARKVSGADRRDMLTQFMVESVVVYAAAVLLAATVIQLVRDSFRMIFDISIAPLTDVSHGDKTLLVSFIFAGIITSALYPIYSSSFSNPAKLFKLAKPTRDRRWYSALSVVQFSVALVVIVVGLVVALQLEKVLSKSSDVGNAIVIIESPIDKDENYSKLAFDFRDRLSRMSGVQAATTTTRVVGDYNVPDFEVKRLGSDHHYGVERSGVDENCLQVFNVELIAGRNFVRDDRADAVIISTTAAERLGFLNPHDAVGAKIHASMGMVRSWKVVEVVGVINDMETVYHFKTSTHSPIKQDGLLFTYGDKLFSGLAAERIAIQLQPSDAPEILKEAQSLFESLFPGSVFSWYFHDDYVNRVYFNERIVRNQIVLFTTLAVIIASIGLLGVMSFEVIERRKEIGIRKVLGARLTQIGVMLIRSTGYHLLIAVATAFPVAYYLSNQYLEKFSLQIELSWWHFAAPVCVLILILLLTVLSTVLKAANDNPVEALKHD